MPADAEMAVPGRSANAALRDRVGTVLLALVVVSLAVQVLGVFNRNVNWDEFLFLSNVYQVARGEAVGLLQTSYAHIFGWLTRIGGDEMTQIRVARALYVVIWTGSLGLLYRLARQLLDPLGALAGVTLFALFSYSLTHAASFRIDGLVLPVLLAVALLVLKPTTARVAAAGALSGLALALTIKASLWAPALAGVLAVSLWHERARLMPLLAGALSAVFVFVAILLVHSWMTAGDGPAPVISARGLTSTGFRMLLEDGFLPRSDVLLRAFLQNPATWMLILAGLVLAIVELRLPLHRRNALLLLLLASPILSIAFYANAWPYAYVVLMPTACLVAGHAVSRYVQSGGNAVRGVAVAICLALVALPMAVSAWMLRSDQTAHQEQVIAIVHRLFDQPVAYIDKGGMISSFPKQPIFLSRWGLKNYHDAGVPVLARYIDAARPPLLILNTPNLDVWDETMMELIDPQFRLLAEDAEALRAAYAPYWGPIYLAGRQWRDISRAEMVTFDIAIPGEYTLISRGSATIDGSSYEPGATVSLEAGSHSLQPGQPEPDLRLLWGSGTMLPEDEPPAMPIYTGL